MIKIITFPSDGTVVRIKDSPEGFGVTTIMNPIDGTRMLIGGLGWEIDQVLAVAPGKRPAIKPPIALFPISMFLAAIWILRWMARK